MQAIWGYESGPGDDPGTALRKGETSGHHSGLSEFGSDNSLFYSNVLMTYWMPLLAPFSIFVEIPFIA